MLKDKISENNDDFNFGVILRRERKKLGLSFKELEAMLSKDESKDNGITASYLNRIENNNMNNPSFKIVCSLVEKLNLDFNEVIKSFGYEFDLNGNNKYKNIEQFIRSKDIEIEAPLYQDGGQIFENSNLTVVEKELLIELLDTFFTFGVAADNALLNKIKNMIEILEKYRSSRMKILNKCNESDITE